MEFAARVTGEDMAGEKVKVEVTRTQAEIGRYLAFGSSRRSHSSLGAKNA